MIQSIIDEYTEHFGIVDILNINKIAQCKKTSFVWSNNAGSLCLAMNKRYFDQAARNPSVTGIITTPNIQKHDNLSQDKCVIISKKADELFYFIHNAGIHSIDTLGTSDNQYVAPSASISPTASLGRHVYIDDNVTIHHGCLVCDYSVIKRNSVLHPYVTVGTEGFFSKFILGTKVHVKHYGGVQIGRNCILHTGTNISRSVNYGENTELGNNVHIGIQSNIGHDCKVGAGTDISAKVLLAGRVKVGRNCWLGAGTIISNALSIGDNASVKIGSVVIEDVSAASTISGNFAVEHKKNLRMYLKSKNNER